MPVLQPGQDIAEENQRPGDTIFEPTRGEKPDDHIDNDPIVGGG